MNASLPSALLRLREADIVRLCGFEAATRGLELAGRQAVSRMRRDGIRLEATITDETPLTVVAETTDGAPNPMLRWSCSAHLRASAGDALVHDGPGCEHVAALLTAWIRAPGDFAVPAQAPTPSRAPGASDSSAGPPAHAIARARHGASRAQKRPTATADTTLAGELARLPTRDLLAMARRTVNADLTESEARERLAAILANPEHVSAILGQLETHPRWLFGALLALGGAITAADLEALAGRLGRPTSAIDADAQALARRGLLFSVLAPRGEENSGKRSWRALAGWRIAPETQAAANNLYSLEALLRGGADGVTLSAAGWRIERSSPRDILLALALLARAPAPFGPLARERHAGSSAHADTRMQPLRVLGDLPAVRLAELARAAGIEPGMARMARRLLLWAREQAPGQPLLDLARLPQDELTGALRQAFALWRETDSVAELVDLSDVSIRARMETRHPAWSPAALAVEVGAARRFLLSLLKHARPGVWYAFDDLLTFVWRAHPGFLRGRQRAFAHPTWTLEQAGGERRMLRAASEDEWRAAEGVWIRALIAGPLRWWGAVDIAQDANSRAPVAFRMTPFGVYLMDARDRPADVTLPEDWRPAILLTREHALAANPLSAGADLLDALAQWARPTSVAGGRLLYILAPDLTCAAFDHGLKPEALGERLRAADPHAGARIAEQVMARLSAWRLKYGRARIFERVALLEARDEPTLAEALSYAPAIAARAQRIGPATALLALSDLSELRARLARKGYEL